MLNKKTLVALLAGVVLLGSGTAWAKVTPAEAEKLKGELTPFGAERAGNADGSIPAWEGGLKGIPEGADYEGPGDFHPDPFKDDKILYTITAANMGQYQDKLSEGVKALFNKFPDFKMNVYQTRRTASAPQEIYDNTFKNATSVELTADKQGLILNGGGAGIPFPIPKNGNEAIFNHNLRWRGTGMEGEFFEHVTQPNGKVSPTGGGLVMEKYPYYEKDNAVENYYQLFVQYRYPTRRNGELLLVMDAVNLTETPRKAWQYLPGQRRVRRAPSVAYDTPNPATSGLAVYDEAFVFNGGLDRYDWKLIGKKEVYIPYNNYAYDNASQKEVFTPNYPNPEFMRWELHRVWIVEANLAEGKRHSYAKRVFYLDEDSWHVALSDNYDSKDKLWRFSWATSKNVYELPAYVSRGYTSWDITRNDYTTGFHFNDAKKHCIFESSVDQDYYTAENMRRLGRR